MNNFMKVSSAVALALGLGMGTAQAENSLRSGNFAITVPVEDRTMDGSTNFTPFMINGKVMVANDMAVTAGLGLGIWGGDTKGTDIGIKGGFRKYLKTADFAPFFGGNLQYISYNDSFNKDLKLMAEFGAEYFLSRQFSIEGAARAGYSQTEANAGTPASTKSNMFGTYGAGLSVNYYF
ncbi:hypothetical protein [Kaarinaea lacus]